MWGSMWGKVTGLNAGLGVHGGAQFGECRAETGPAGTNPVHMGLGLEQLARFGAGSQSQYGMLEKGKI